MKKIVLEIDDSIYIILKNLLSVLPKDKVKIVESEEEKGKKNKILKLAGSIDRLKISPLEYQKKLREEWDLDESII